MIKNIKKILSKLSDIKNAYRVLQIMSKCGCDIERVNINGLEDYNYWKVKPKWYISEKEAKDLQNIILFQKNYYGNHPKIFKLLFNNIRDGYRYTDWM